MRARKVDANQRAIVGALRAAGCSVFVTSDVGCGFPDLVVGRHNYRGGSFTYLLEIKSSHKASLTAEQRRFRAEWRGHYAIVWDVDTALIAVGIIK